MIAAPTSGLPTWNAAAARTSGGAAGTCVCPLPWKTVNTHTAGAKSRRADLWQPHCAQTSCSAPSLVAGSNLMFFTRSLSSMSSSAPPFADARSATYAPGLR